MRLILPSVLVLSALGLSGCTLMDLQHGFDVAAVSAPAVNSAVQSYATLNASLLASVAAANPNNAKVQAVVAKIQKGNAIAAADAATLAAYLPTIGIVVDQTVLVGKTIGATIAVKK
jgi:hypothetical protein